MKRETLANLKKFISNNVTPPEKGFVSRFWPKEIKLAKELFSIFPDDAFWGSVTIGYKVNSLAWFKTKKGHLELETKYKEFHFVPVKTQEVLPISDRKFGESTHNIRSPRTLRDFLK